MNSTCRTILLILCKTLGYHSSDTNITDLYLQFLIRHDKDMSRLYDDDRVFAFKNAIDTIEGLHSFVESGPYHLRINHFADWNEGELLALFTEPYHGATSNHSLESSTWYNMVRSSLSLPEEINWASAANPLGRSTLSGVHNQGSCGM